MPVRVPAQSALLQPRYTTVSIAMSKSGQKSARLQTNNHWLSHLNNYERDCGFGEFTRVFFAIDIDGVLNGRVYRILSTTLRRSDKSGPKMASCFYQITF